LKIVLEEYGLSPRLGIVCIDLLIPFDDESDAQTDWLCLTQYIGFGMDYQWCRCYPDDWIEWAGITNDPELEQLGRNILMSPFIK